MSRHFPIRKKKTQERTSLIEKGSTDAIKVDKDEIERIVVTLRDNYEVPIESAPKNLISLMNKLRLQATNLTGTETYEDFYKIIMKHFGDIKAIIPGTIGAFCYGCSTVTGFTGMKSCAATCIGNIPTPDMPNWIDCDSNIFLLYYPKLNDVSKNIDQHIWKDLHTVGYDKLSYIFIINDDKDNSGSGNINGIEEIMRNKGITKYSLYILKAGVYKHIKTGKIQKQHSSTTWGPQTPGGGRTDMRNHFGVPVVNGQLGLIRGRGAGNSKITNKGAVLGTFLLLFLLIIIAVTAFSMRKKKR